MQCPSKGCTYNLVCITAKKCAEIYDNGEFWCDVCNKKDFEGPSFHCDHHRTQNKVDICQACYNKDIQNIKTQKKKNRHKKNKKKNKKKKESEEDSEDIEFVETKQSSHNSMQYGASQTNNNQYLLNNILTQLANNNNYNNNNNINNESSSSLQSQLYKFPQNQYFDIGALNKPFQQPFQQPQYNHLPHFLPYSQPMLPNFNSNNILKEPNNHNINPLPNMNKNINTLVSNNKQDIQQDIQPDIQPHIQPHIQPYIQPIQQDIQPADIQQDIQPTNYINNNTNNDLNNDINNNQQRNNVANSLKSDSDNDYDFSPFDFAVSNNKIIVQVDSNNFKKFKLNLSKYVTGSSISGLLAVYIDLANGKQEVSQQIINEMKTMFAEKFTPLNCDQKFECDINIEMNENMMMLAQKIEPNVALMMEQIITLMDSTMNTNALIQYLEFEINNALSQYFFEIGLNIKSFVTSLLALCISMQRDIVIHCIADNIINQESHFISIKQTILKYCNVSNSDINSELSKSVGYISNTKSIHVAVGSFVTGFIKCDAVIYAGYQSENENKEKNKAKYYVQHTINALKILNGLAKVSPSTSQKLSSSTKEESINLLNSSTKEESTDLLNSIQGKMNPVNEQKKSEHNQQIENNLKTSIFYQNLCATTNGKYFANKIKKLYTSSYNSKGKKKKEKPITKENAHLLCHLTFDLLIKKRDCQPFNYDEEEYFVRKPREAYKIDRLASHWMNLLSLVKQDELKNVVNQEWTSKKQNNFTNCFIRRIYPNWLSNSEKNQKNGGNLTKTEIGYCHGLRGTKGGKSCSSKSKITKEKMAQKFEKAIAAVHHLARKHGLFSDLDGKPQKGPNYNFTLKTMEPKPTKTELISQLNTARKLPTIVTSATTSNTAVTTDAENILPIPPTQDNLDTDMDDRYGYSGNNNAQSTHQQSRVQTLVNEIGGRLFNKKKAIQKKAKTRSFTQMNKDSGYSINQLQLTANNGHITSKPPQKISRMNNSLKNPTA